jgi:hypothetical protein
MTPQELKLMPLNELAALISKDWKKVYFGAVPYLQAMRDLNSVDDDYGMDSGKSIVRYFLANASTWRGEVAKAVKTELKRRVN